MPKLPNISPKSDPEKNKKPGFNLTWVYFIIIIGLGIMLYQGNQSNPGGVNKEVDYTTFRNYVKQGVAKEVVVNKTEGNVRMVVRPEKIREIYKQGSDQTGSAPTVSTKYPNIDTINGFLDANYQGSVKYEESDKFFMSLLSSLLPIILLVFLWFFLMRRMGGGGGSGGIFNVGKSKARLFDKNGKNATHVTFKDVAGQEGAKQEIREIVDFLKNPQKYTELGGKIPKGALLVGPPGTGKTLLAKAVAGEAKVPFFSISCSELIEMFVGMGAARVRDLFKQAQEKAPCIVFIDEIDAIGKKRDNGAFGSNDEREQTLNQLLSEMDGFDGSKGVIILAATNRPEVLDKALLRPGRFDRRVPVELPDLKGREAILKVHSHDVRISPNVDYHTVALATSGASGAELANIVNEAALRAVRMGRTEVIQEDLEESVEVVIAGAQRKGAVISEKEKQLIAYHEIGHALVAASQTASAPVHKITIIPRTSGALGYTMQVDTEEKVLMTKEELFNKIVTLTGGRSAEEVVFNKVTSGASNDIEQATKLARAMITRFGMTSDFDMVALETVNNAYLSGDTSLACAPETAARIDEAVFSVVKEAHQKARTILETHRQKLDELAQYLLKKETITGDEFMAILKGTDPASAAAEQVPNSPQEGA